MAEPSFTGSLKPGGHLGKYEIRGQLGTGGMAIVYKAHDPGLDRFVAIKQIAPHLAQDARFLERFRSEAQTLARLSSSQPNIVTVHELIQQDGQLYLVMECVEGTTLREMMDRGPVALQTGLGVLLSTSLGLRAMHAQGIVHRDLSPANLMMAKDGTLKITDFGLIGHSGGRTSLPMGTTKYMAPEMFTGAPVDPRADIYSLGMIAYEMFVGPQKFAEAFKDVLRDERAQQVRWMHWHSNPALRAPPLKDLQPGIPPLVSKIVERMMDKDPSKRFAAADQIVRWLRRIFVMHVQNKSISATDSESMEKELDAEATGAVGAAVRESKAGALASAAAPAKAQEPPGEKTAPLPVPKWTWKRAAFWAAVVAGPLIIASTALLIWKYTAEQKRMDIARNSQRMADDLFRSKAYADASKQYLQIVQDFRDLPDVALYAMQHAMMSRAEDALEKKDWRTADEAASAAERKYEAAPAWVSNFRERFIKGREVEVKINDADLAQKSGDFEKAIAILSDLSAQNPDLRMPGDVKLNDFIAELRDKLEMREYRRLVDEGKQAVAKGTPDAASDFFGRARKIRETPEILELIQSVENDRKASQFYTQAEKAVADGKWAEARNLYAEVLKYKPSEAVRKKMNNTQAEDLAAQAALLKQNGLVKEALALYVQVQQLNPQHADALAFIRIQGQKETLENYIKAGDDAMGKEQWDSAINSYMSAQPLLDPKDTATKQRIDGQIAEARYRAAMKRAQDAFAQNQFDSARSLAAEAQGHKDSQEVKDFLAQVDKRQQFKQHLDLGKELLAQGSYVKGLAAFQQAQKVEDGPDVQEFIRETQYRRYLVQGNSLMKDFKYQEALAMYRMAQRYTDGPEVQARIQQVMALLNAPKKP